MAQFLVTGIAGFIGSSLARALLGRGHQVRGVDNFSTGRRQNLTEIMGQIDLEEADLADPGVAVKVCRDVDYILHEAAIPSVPRSLVDPAGSNRSSVDATLNLLIAARDSKVKRVVYAASSSAYGNTRTLPKREDMPTAPISPYAVAKLAGELYMQSFQRCYGLETVCLRYFNIFGPRQDPTSQYSGVLAKFITRMLAHETPHIFGDGSQSRDFTYIENVVNANLLACEGESTCVAGRVFNVATGTRISLNQVVQELRTLTGYQGKVMYDPERKGDVKHSLADISAAQKSFGYAPSVDFPEGLRRTVEWYRRAYTSAAQVSLQEATAK